MACDESSLEWFLRPAAGFVAATVLGWIIRLGKERYGALRLRREMKPLDGQLCKVFEVNRARELGADLDALQTKFRKVLLTPKLLRVDETLRHIRADLALAIIAPAGDAAEALDRARKGAQELRVWVGGLR